MNDISPPPIPQSSTTVDGALIDLAGAAMAALDIFLADNPDATADDNPWMAILIAGVAQWNDSGFFIKEGNAAAKHIAETFGYIDTE